MRIRRLLRSGLALLALGLGAASRPGPVTATAHAIPAPGSHLHCGPCRAFPGARQLPGADGIVPAAWPGGGLVVPACGPAPGDGTTATAVYPYPDALWTAGYQCVEFSERPRAVAGTRYSFALTATDGKPPYRWRVTSGALPAGLALSPAGVLSGMARAGAAAVTPTGGWPVDVAVTDARGATATAGLSLSVAGALAAPAGNLRHAEWAWHDQYNEER